MATRCNIKITDGQSTIYLYRHWDGYMAETGADLYEKIAKKPYLLQSYTSPATVAMHLIAEGAEVPDVQPDGATKPYIKHTYELTDGVHGDIEHFYEIRLTITEDTCTASFGHAQGYGPQIEAAVKFYTAEQFIGMVNAERKAMNARIDELCKVPAYAKMYGTDRYEMLTV